MTREEWIAEIPKSVFTAYELSFEQYANDACEQIDILVNCIIDDFENRTCKSCKYYDDGYFGAYTGKKDKCGFGLGSINEYGTIFTEADFGCNKWEEK